MSNLNEMVMSLQKEVQQDAAFNAVAHVLALRERARGQLTLRALSQRMKKEKFNYSDAQYAAILKKLAHLGFGRLDTDFKGRVRGLKEIKMTLQSIGAAACGQKVSLSHHRQRNRFLTVVPPTDIRNAPPTQAERRVSALAQIEKIALSVVINGKSLKLEIPREFTAEEVSAVISQLGGLSSQPPKAKAAV